MNQEGLLPWLFQRIPAGFQRAVQHNYEHNPATRFILISMAVISQVVGLLVTGLIGVVIGSALVHFLSS